MHCLEYSSAAGTLYRKAEDIREKGKESDQHHPGLSWHRE